MRAIFNQRSKGLGDLDPSSMTDSQLTDYHTDALTSLNTLTGDLTSDPLATASGGYSWASIFSNPIVIGGLALVVFILIDKKK